MTVGGNRRKNEFVRYYLYFDDGTNPNTVLGVDPVIGYVLIAIMILCLVLSLVGGGIAGFFVWRKMQEKKSINQRMGKGTAEYDITQYDMKDDGAM